MKELREMAAIQEKEEWWRRRSNLDNDLQVGLLCVQFIITFTWVTLILPLIITYGLWPWCKRDFKLKIDDLDFNLKIGDLDLLLITLNYPLSTTFKWLAYIFELHSFVPQNYFIWWPIFLGVVGRHGALLVWTLEMSAVTQGALNTGSQSGPMWPYKSSQHWG